MKKNSWFSRFLELLGSMRLAVSLLVIVSIASVIGTIIEQNMPDIVYQDQFGLFWFDVFNQLSIFSIYNATWFLVVVGFLCVSTTLCVIRRSPGFIREMKSYRLGVREKSFAGFKHQGVIYSRFEKERTLELIKHWLKIHKYQFKEEPIDNHQTLVAAKKGMSIKLGYIFAHVAIVVICLGGLLDSELSTRLYVLFSGKQGIPENALLISDVPQKSWLSSNNLSFKANVQLSSRAQIPTDVATVFLGDDRFLQELPFSMQLDEFRIEYYEGTAMPKRYSSLVTFEDKVTHEKTQQIVEVNHPYTSHGITVYQSSFADGGSQAWFNLYPLVPEDSTLSFSEMMQIQGGDIRFVSQVQGSPISLSQNYVLRVLEVKPLNIELSQDEEVISSFGDRVLGSALPKNVTKVNYGPSVRYVIQHPSGDHEYLTYVDPIHLGDGLYAHVTVVDPQLGGQAKLLRIPVDPLGTANEFNAIRKAFQLDSVREEAAKRFVADFPLSQDMVQGALTEEMQVNLVKSVSKVFSQQGFEGLQTYAKNAAQFVINQNNAQEDDAFKERILHNFEGFFSQIVQGVLVEVRNIVRGYLSKVNKAYATPIAIENGQVDALSQSWTLLSMIAISNLNDYPQPFYFGVDQIKHIQDTVLQVTRSPGKWVVYIGSILLMLGVYFMIFIRDRRVWFICSQEEQGVRVRFAMTTQKYTFDFQQEFDGLKKDFSEMDKGKL